MPFFLFFIAEAEAACPDLPLLPVRRCQQCPVGWLTFDQQCFYLSTTRLNWDDSQKNCSASGGSLAVIETKKIQVDVMRLSAAALRCDLKDTDNKMPYHRWWSHWCSELQDFLTKKGNLPYWIGLKQNNAKKWTWYDNTTLTQRWFLNLFLK